MKKMAETGFDPKPTGYPFGEFTDLHYLKVRKNDGTVFDEDYPYIDVSRLSRFVRSAVGILCRVIVYPVMRIRLGLRVYGRENLKAHRNVLKLGAVSCSNHVHMWDFLAVKYAVRPFVPDVLVWAANVRGENGKMIRAVGGIPVPEDSPKASSAMISCVRKYVSGGGWLHVYPEGSMWEYYRPVRPFKSGAAYVSRVTGRPVVPIGISYRRPGWLRRTVFRQKALFNLEIGEPVYPDVSLERRLCEEDLLKKCHSSVCRLAGIPPGENIYPPVFDKTRRKDYY